MSSNAATIKKQLKIKSGSVKRLMKEHKMYLQETVDLRAKVAKQTSENADEYDIKNTNNMINESHRVIDEVAGRLKVAAEQLQQYADAIDLESLEGDEEPMQTARDVLQEVRAVVDMDAE